MSYKVYDKKTHRDVTDKYLLTHNGKLIQLFRNEADPSRLWFNVPHNREDLFLELKGTNFFAGDGDWQTYKKFNPISNDIEEAKEKVREAWADLLALVREIPPSEIKVTVQLKDLP